MIDLRRLLLLRELAERGTIAATAEALHLTPSAVSQQLATLARETGTQLLEPNGRRVRLTAAAQVLINHAHALFAQMETAQADLAAYTDGLVGMTRLGAFATAITGLVTPALLALRRSHPRLSVRVSETDAPEEFRLLQLGEIDILVSMDYTGAPRADDPRFARTRLWDDVLDAFLPADHPLATKPGLGLVELRDDAWIVGNLTTSCRAIAVASCVQSGFTPNIHHSCNDWVGVTTLVAGGLGVALVPRLANATSAPGIVVRRLANPPIRHIFAATRRGGDAAPHIRPVLDALLSTAAGPASQPSP